MEYDLSRIIRTDIKLLSWKSVLSIGLTYLVAVAVTIFISGIIMFVGDTFDGTNNFENERETSFYIYTLHNLSGYLKFGIAFDPKTRASASQGYYADNILEKVFASRHAAFFFEQAILEATRDLESYHQQLIDIEWVGLTEVRQMNQEDAIELFEFFESELEQVSLWDFAARYVPMTDTQRKICLERAKSDVSGED